MNRIERSLVALLACLLLGPLLHSVEGQPAPEPRPGDRVRVAHTDRCCANPQVGALVSVSLDSIVIRTDSARGAALIALPRSAVRRLELGYDAGSHAWRGAGIGALVGLVTGATLVIAQDCEDDAFCGSFKPYLAVVAGGTFGLAGALIGGLIGLSVRREEWVSVPVPARLGLAPAPKGGGLALRLTLRL